MRQRYYVTFTGNKGKLQYELTSFHSASVRFFHHWHDVKHIKLLDANTGEVLREALNGKIIYYIDREADTEI